jgi:hypothetical protein
MILPQRNANGMEVTMSVTLQAGEIPEAVRRIAGDDRPVG